MVDVNINEICTDGWICIQAKRDSVEKNDVDAYDDPCTNGIYDEFVIVNVPLEDIVDLKTKCKLQSVEKYLQQQEQQHQQQHQQQHHQQQQQMIHRDEVNLPFDVDLELSLKRRSFG